MIKQATLIINVSITFPKTFNLQNDKQRKLKVKNTLLPATVTRVEF